MTVLWIVLGVVAYLLIGLGFVYLLGIEPTHGDQVGPAMCGIFWPIIGPYILGALAVVGLMQMFVWAAKKGARR